jgi:hypothetical protein
MIAENPCNVVSYIFRPVLGAVSRPSVRGVEYNEPQSGTGAFVLSGFDHHGAGTTSAFASIK